VLPPTVAAGRASARAAVDLARADGRLPALVASRGVDCIIEGRRVAAAAALAAPLASKVLG
jgi:hypothetical protein